MKRLRSVFGLILIVGLGACQQTESSPSYLKIVGPTMGTVYTISYQDSLQRDIRPLVDSFLIEFNQKYSTYDSSAFLAKWNRGEGLLSTTREIFEFIKFSSDMKERTNGYLDITLKPAIEMWKFYGNEDFQVPSQEKLDSIQQFIGGGILFVDNADGLFIGKIDPRIQIDVNSVAPGLAVDQLYAELIRFGLENFIIDIGGEVRTSGNYNGGMWKIGIQKPETAESLQDRKVFAVAKMYSGAVATSGNYQKFKKQDGVVYGHTFNPITLKPEQNNLLSVTTYCQTALEADAYSTALMSMGLEKAKEFVEQTDGLDALILYTDSLEIKSWNSLAFPIEYLP